MGSLRRLLGGTTAPPPASSVLQPRKLWAIDELVGRTAARSLVDCGGVWAVEAGYALHAADAHALDRVTVVDTGITDGVRDAATSRPSLRLEQANFGDPDVVGRVAPTDAVLLYDVLLHQVAPDWDEVFRMWAADARGVAVVQPFWHDADDVVRLVELGEERFLDTVPDEPNHRALFGRLDEVHPAYDRPWRDVHEVWQWGIGVHALDRVARDLGLHRVVFVDDGPWMGLSSFRYQTAIYTRDPDPAR